MLQHCVKSQKVFGETSWCPFWVPPPHILNITKNELTDTRLVKYINKEKYRFHCFITCSVEVICIATAIILENIFGNIKIILFFNFFIYKILLFLLKFRLAGLTNILVNL